MRWGHVPDVVHQVDRQVAYREGGSGEGRREIAEELAGGEKLDRRACLVGCDRRADTRRRS
jgi:hypothetical protein